LEAPIAVCGSPSLASGWRSLDHNKVDGTARFVIIENANRQPSRAPTEGIEVGAAFVEQRAIAAIVVAMDDVERPEAVWKSLRIALPQQRRFALPIQGNIGVDAGMNVEAMRIGIDQPQSVEPVDMGLRNGCGIAAIGYQRGVAALGDPRRHLRGIAQRFHHQGVVVALQRNQAEAIADARQEPLNDALAVRSLVDVIADRDDDAGPALGTRGNFRKSIIEQIASAVDVWDNESQTHETMKIPARIGGALTLFKQSPFATSPYDCKEVEVKSVVAYLPSMIQRVSTVVGWLALAFIVYATLSPINARPVLAGPQLEHFAAFFLVGLAFALGYPSRVLLVVVIVVGAAVGLEALQMLTPDRHARVTDAFVKALGGIGGISVGQLVWFVFWLNRTGKIIRPDF